MFPQQNFGVSRDERFNGCNIQNSFGLPSIDDISKKSPTLVGQLIYQTTSETIFYSDGLKWIEICAADYIAPADYIIIGAGSAGCILARVLSDNGASVITLDVGDFRYEDPVILNPIWQLNANTLLFGQKYAKDYPVPVGFLQGAVYSEGSGSVGGSAAHNFLIAGRGTPRIYDSWAATSGDNSWNYTNILPTMKALEKYTPDGTIANPAERGSVGPISITQSAPLVSTPGTFYPVLATASGSTMTTDYNDGSQTPICISADQSLITSGVGSRRSYSALEFLPMVPTVNAVIDANGNGINGRNLKIITSAKAIKIGFNGTQAVSVDYILGGDVSTINKVFLKPGGKVISCAGALQTPKLLLLSGIGPAADLTTLSIPVVVDSPQVGKNLKNQYGCSAVILPTGPSLPIQAAEAYINCTPYIPPVIQRKIQLICLGANPSTGNVFPILPSLLTPASSGSMKIVSKNSLIELEIDMNMYSDVPGPTPWTTPNSDANLIVSALKVIKDAADAAGFTMIAPSSAEYLAGDAALFSFATNLSNRLIQSHITGTTQMGSSIANGVVDGNLKVFGLDNVYVCDIGVEPLPTDGNTCMGAYYLARRLAEKLGFPISPVL